jgi:outer membrane receptor protein involved in Fe transport
VNQDLYNVDRIETARGPNSILFGVGDIGGSITTYTKVPRLDRDLNNATLTLNSFGAVRLTGDVNRVAGENFAVRVNALLERDRGWRQHDEDETKAIDVHMVYKLSDQSKLRLEIEGYDQENQLYAFTLQDSTSLWSGNGVDTWGAVVPGAELNPLTNPGAPGVRPMTAWGPTTLVWIPDLGLMNWRAGYRSMGTNDIAWGAYMRRDPYTFGPTGTEIPALPSKDFTVAPGDGYLRSRFYSVTGVWEQTINENMEFQLTGYRYEDTQKSQNYENATAALIDVNRQLPNGQANPNYGKTYSEMFLNRQNQLHSATEFRGQLNYHFETELFGEPLRQWFGLSAGYRKTELNPRTYLAFDVPGITPDNWIEHMVWGRLYWDNPNQSMNLPEDQIHYLAMPFNWFDFNLEEEIKYVGLVSQTRLLSDRLALTLGARRDMYENFKQGIRPTTAANTPTTVDEEGTTVSAGVIYYLTDWLGVNYNYSENFAPLAGGVAPSLYGEPHGAAKGQGQTVGVRVSTSDGRYYASANYYRDVSEGRIKGGPGFQGIWNRYLDAGGTNRDIGPAGVITGTGESANASMNFADTTDLKSTGFEFELTANPNANWRLQANFAFPDSELSNSIPDSIRYYDEHIATWQETASTPSGDPAIQAQRNLLQTDLTNLSNEINSLRVPVISDHLVESTASVFATYIFTGERLRGWQLGAGATVLGKQYGNPWDNVNGERIKSPGYTLFNMMLGYDTTLNVMNREVRAKFQLNVDNLLGEDKLVFRSYQAYGTGAIQPMDYDFLEPRRFTLTSSFSF